LKKYTKERKIVWTQNAISLSWLTPYDIKTVETAKTFIHRYKHIRGKLAEGTFKIRPLDSSGIPWLRGLFILRDGSEHLIDITYDANDCTDEIPGIPIDVLGLSVKAYNALKRSRYNTVEKALVASDDDLIEIRSVGKTTRSEIKTALKKYEESGLMDSLSFEGDDEEDLDIGDII